MKSFYQNQAVLRNSYKQWLSAIQWDIALTLNFKADISRQAAGAAAQFFWQDTDRWIYGQRAVKKHGRRLTRVVFLEGGKDSHNWHYHAAVKLPDAGLENRLDANIANDPDMFGAALIKRWQELREAGRFSKAELCWNSDGWISYICKTVDRGEAQFEPHISTLP